MTLGEEFRGRPTSPIFFSAGNTEPSTIHHRSDLFSCGQANSTLLDSLNISGQQYRLPPKPPVDCFPFKTRGPQDGLKPSPRGPRPQANSGQDRFRMMMEDIDADLHAGHSSGRTNYRQPLAFPEIRKSSFSCSFKPVSIVTAHSLILNLSSHLGQWNSRLWSRF